MATQVEVRGLSVGPAEGESKPLASLDRVSLRVDAMAAARSEGKDLQVLEGVLGGLTVNVLRFANGTTNLERLLAKLESEKQPKAEPKQEPSSQSSADLSGLLVHHAALLDERFALLDQATPGAQELQISDVDLEVRDLRVGKSLEVVLKAAVLSSAQNFEVDVKTTPLGPKLEAGLEQVTLTAKGIDLGPLGPFLGSEVGLRAGKLDALWKGSPGALVPGGTGPAEISGSIAAQGLAFAASEQGKPLDVQLETDVQLDSVAGNADIRRLLFEAGPARLTGKGRVEKLNLDELCREYPPLKKQLGGQLGDVVSPRVRKEGSAQEQALVAELDLTGARLNVPDQLTKSAGAPLKVRADISGAAALQTLRFKLDADMAGVDLRPGKSLNKTPGQPFFPAPPGQIRGRDLHPSRRGVPLRDGARRRAHRQSIRGDGLGGETRTPSPSASMAAPQGQPQPGAGPSAVGRRVSHRHPG